MSEQASEKTPESGGQKALEDIQPEHGAMVRPQGTPTVLGPQINPFWSESARDEAILRACRPAHLPQESQEAFPPQVSSVSPPREPAEAFRVMMNNLMRENAGLWTEREAEMASQNMWRQQPCSYGPQQSWLGSVLGEGLGHERRAVREFMEVMKASLTAAPKDPGLLGPLALPADVGSGVFFPRHDVGPSGGYGSLTKGSLLEMFKHGLGWGPLGCTSISRRNGVWQRLGRSVKPQLVLGSGSKSAGGRFCRREGGGCVGKRGCW